MWKLPLALLIIEARFTMKLLNSVYLLTNHIEFIVNQVAEEGVLKIYLGISIVSIKCSITFRVLTPSISFSGVSIIR